MMADKINNTIIEWNESPFNKRWLHGTTCAYKNQSIAWVSEDQRFVLMKHHGHSEYCGRWYGTLWCETYYALYDKLDTMRPKHSNRTYLRKWEGKWLKKYWVELRELVNDNA